MDTLERAIMAYMGREAYIEHQQMVLGKTLEELNELTRPPGQTLAVYPPCEANGWKYKTGVSRVSGRAWSAWFPPEGSDGKIRWVDSPYALRAGAF